jgi:hypothetical protein
MSMLWIAYDPSCLDQRSNREQFNGERPAWGEAVEDFEAKQGIDVPLPGDQLSLRMGTRTVDYRRLECPETDDEGRMVSGWYWTVIVK